MEMHSQPLDLDFNCISTTPTMDFSKKGSPKSAIGEPIYGNKTVCELSENSEAILGGLNGTDIFATNGLGGSDRLSGDYDINAVLPPPKSRELAIGESYSDIGKCLDILNAYFNYLVTSVNSRLERPCTWFLFNLQVQRKAKVILQTARK